MEMKKQSAQNFRTKLQSLVIVFATLFVTAFACGDNGDNPPPSNYRGGDLQPADNGNGNPPGAWFTYQKGIGKKYGTRDPRTCTNTAAPTTGAITADLAAKYLMCQREGEASDLLYLIDDARVQVGGGINYASIRASRVLYEIDVNHPVYPIRGTYTKNVCSRIYDENAKSNCTTETVKADGYCYKTTFGDWQCRY